MTAVRAGLVAALTAVAATAAGGQQIDAMPSVEFGIAAGVFIDYPHQFTDLGCGDGAVGMGVEARYWFTGFLGVEGSVAWSGEPPGRSCAYGVAPLPIGVPFEQTLHAEGIRGAAFFATTIGAVVEPFLGSDLSPRLRVARGRMWDKKLPFWSAGVGVRYKFGRHALLMDVERWKLTLDAQRQVIIVQPSGEVDVLSSETVTSDETPYLVRVGWGFAIGR
jgi:hypothetical protein